MHWYKISEGDTPDEYVEITVGHETKYSKEEFLALVMEIEVASPRRAWNLAQELINNHGFVILPVAQQYHFERETMPQ